MSLSHSLTHNAQDSSHSDLTESDTWQNDKFRKFRASQNVSPIFTSMPQAPPGPSGAPMRQVAARAGLGRAGGRMRSPFFLVFVPHVYVQVKPQG